MLFPLYIYLCQSLTNNDIWRTIWAIGEIMKRNALDDGLASVESYRTNRQEALQSMTQDERLKFLIKEQKRARKIAKDLLDTEGDGNA